LTSDRSSLGYMNKLQIGTSGWVYKHWMDIFYPLNLPSDRQLSFYSLLIAHCQDPNLKASKKRL
jgi:hypothetical protein